MSVHFSALGLFVRNHSISSQTLSAKCDKYIVSRLCVFLILFVVNMIFYPKKREEKTLQGDERRVFFINYFLT